MKILRFTLICFFVFSSTITNAQNLNSQSIDSLKNQVLKFLVDGKSSTSKYTIWLYYNKEKETFSGIGPLNGDISINENQVVFPTATGNYMMMLRDIPAGPGYKYEEPAYNNEKKAVRSIYIGKMNLEIVIEKYKRKDYYQIYQDVIKKSELFTRSLQRLRLELLKADYKKFENDYKTLDKRIEDSNVTEDQRKLIVQANHFNDKKEYKKSIEYFNHAIDINPLSYPAAYFNMALISGELQDYGIAILNMKKYLLLAPNADDAREAQDKIYEWEADLNEFIFKYLQ